MNAYIYASLYGKLNFFFFFFVLCVFTNHFSHLFLERKMFHEGFVFPNVISRNFLKVFHRNFISVLSFAVFLTSV